MKRLLVILMALFTVLLLGRAVTASATVFPIAQLGNCTNQQDCANYCEEPQNHAACWSYQTYVMDSQVLAAQTASSEARLKTLGVTFPITALGNCSSVAQCKLFCDQPQYQATCTNFALKYGLGQSASTNPTVQRYLQDAQQFLGCNDYTTCKAFCSDPTNRSKCEEFSAREGINRTALPKLPASFSQALFAAAQTELGCNSDDSCQTYCQKTNNLTKCLTFAIRHQLVSVPVPLPTTKPPITATGAGTIPNEIPGTCSTTTECYQYCYTHPGACPGFPKPPTPPAPATNSYHPNTGGSTNPSTTYPTTTYPQPSNQ